MRILKSAIVIILALIFSAAAAGWADTIILKNGTQYKGAVIRETRDEVEAVLDAGMIRLRRAEVASIKKGSVWENNFYLKKYQESQLEAEAARPPKEIKAVSVAPAVHREEAGVEKRAAPSTEISYRERELELRKQELELKKTELELQKEELKLKRDEFEAGTLKEREAIPEEGLPTVEKVRKIPEKKAVEEEVLEEEAVKAGEEEIAPLKKPVSEEEARQIAIEEQQKQQEKRDRVETQRRLQEIRQKQEGVTIRGRVNPASGEQYDTY